jgi:hypothetical protein
MVLLIDMPLFTTFDYRIFTPSLELKLEDLKQPRLAYRLTKPVFYAYHTGGKSQIDRLNLGLR